MTIDEFLYPPHLVFCIINRPSNVGKSVLLTNLILNFINEYDKIYIYSPSLPQEFYQKLINSFTNYLPIHIIPNCLNEEDFDLVFERVINTKDFEKSNSEIETYESIEELKFPQDYDDGGIFILGDLNEKDSNDYWVQAMFKRTRHNKLSIFVIAED